MQLTQIRNSLLYFFVVGFFFFPRLQTIIIAACFVTLLLDKSFYRKFSSVFNNKLGVLMIGYFLILSLSLSYSENLQEGLRSLETKFSFFVFPFFIPFLFSKNFPKENVMKIFLWAGMSYVFVSYIDAAVDYYSTRNIASFFYSELGVGFFQDGSFIHPTYASFFYNILISYLGLKIIDTKKNWTSQVPSIISLLTLSVFVFMLSSKFGILALIINFILLLIYYVKQSKRLMFALVVFGVFGALSVLIISQTPLKKRFSSAYTAMVSPSDKPSSTRARIDVWSVTVELIEENPVWGVGAGDIRNQLMTKYENKGFDLYQKKGYDSHQEFLQTYAALGILGLLTMIGMFLILFLKAFQTGNFLLFIFSFLLLMFGMLESMLERQAGVVFFVFFGLYFFSYNPIKKEK